MKILKFIDEITKESNINLTKYLMSSHYMSNVVRKAGDIAVKKVRACLNRLVEINCKETRGQGSKGDIVMLPDWCWHTF